VNIIKKLWKRLTQKKYKIFILTNMGWIPTQVYVGVAKEEIIRLAEEIGAEYNQRNIMRAYEIRVEENGKVIYWKIHSKLR